MSRLLALVAILPAMVGPLPASARVLHVRLCAGGVATIPIPLRESPAAPCLQKGCHAGCNRRRNDPEQ